MTISAGLERLVRARPAGLAESSKIGVDLMALARQLASGAGVRAFSPDPDRRSWKLIKRSKTFDAWVIGWPPGGAIELHDHGDSAGAIVVCRGSLRETRMVSRDLRPLGFETSNLKAGDGARFDAYCVHDVVNVGDTLAVSVHVYAPRLRSMTFYELDDGVLERLHTTFVC